MNSPTNIISVSCVEHGTSVTWLFRHDSYAAVLINDTTARVFLPLDSQHQVLRASSVFFNNGNCALDVSVTEL